MDSDPYYPRRLATRQPEKKVPGQVPRAGFQPPAGQAGPLGRPKATATPDTARQQPPSADSKLGSLKSQGNALEAQVRGLAQALPKDGGREVAGQLPGKLEEIGLRLAELNQELRKLAGQVALLGECGGVGAGECGSGGVREGGSGEGEECGSMGVWGCGSTEVAPAAEAVQPPQPEVHENGPVTPELRPHVHTPTPTDSAGPEPPAAQDTQLVICLPDDDAIEPLIIGEQPAEQDTEPAPGLPAEDPVEPPIIREQPAEQDTEPAPGLPAEDAVEPLIIGKQPAEQDTEPAPSLPAEDAVEPQVIVAQEVNDAPSIATLEIELAGMTGIVCKSCNRKFPDPEPDRFIKQCPFCNYRFYAHLTYELRMIESRQQRHDRRLRRRTFAQRTDARESRPIRERLAEACGGFWKPFRNQ